MPKRVDDGIRKRCACGRRRWAKCAQAWHFSFHHGHREHRYPLTVIARARSEHPPAGKTEARAWGDRLRAEISGDTFVEPTAPRAATADDRLTFADVTERYLRVYIGKTVGADGHVRWSGRHLRPRTAAQAEYHLRTLRHIKVPAPNGHTVRLEAKSMAAITKADVEAVREARLPRGTIGCNRLLARLRTCSTGPSPRACSTRAPSGGAA